MQAGATTTSEPHKLPHKNATAAIIRCRGRHEYWSNRQPVVKPIEILSDLQVWAEISQEVRCCQETN